MANEPKAAPVQRKGVNVRLAAKYLNENRIIFANVTRFTHVGTDVILDIGTLDDQKFIQIIQQQGPQASEAEGPVIDAFITHRVGLGLQTLLKMKENLDDILSKLLEAGVLEAASEEVKK